MRKLVAASTPPLTGVTARSLRRSAPIQQHRIQRALTSRFVTADLRNVQPFTVLFLAGLGSMLLSAVHATTAERCIAIGLIVVVAGLLDATLCLAVRAAWRSVRR